MSDEFEAWLRKNCFQAPPKECYDLAKSAWNEQQAIIDKYKAMFNGALERSVERRRTIIKLEQVVNMILSAIHANPDLHAELAKTDYTALMELMIAAELNEDKE